MVPVLLSESGVMAVPTARVTGEEAPEYEIEGATGLVLKDNVLPLDIPDVLVADTLK
jgi:hypothetical protein